MKKYSRTSFHLDKEILDRLRELYPALPLAAVVRQVLQSHLKAAEEAAEKARKEILT